MIFGDSAFSTQHELYGTGTGYEGRRRKKGRRRRRWVGGGYIRDIHIFINACDILLEVLSDSGELASVHAYHPEFVHLFIPDARCGLLCLFNIHLEMGWGWVLDGDRRYAYLS